MNEKQIKALARRNAAKAARVKPPSQRAYDETVEKTRPPERDDTDANRIFKEMKKREF
jgi:hypothetical protein